MGIFDFFKKNVVNEEELKKERLTKAAQSGDSEAMFELGELLEEESKYQEAEVWFKSAMEKGHATAKYYLALNYSAGMGGPNNMSLAVQYLNELIEEGYETYCKDLAWIFSNSRNKNHPILKQYYDLKEAEKYYVRAIKAKSESRWVAAVHELGVLYAGKFLYPYLDDDITDPLKAAYCLYMASMHGEYERSDYDTVVNNAGLNISNEQMLNWRSDFDNMEFNI